MNNFIQKLTYLKDHLSEMLILADDYTKQMSALLEKGNGALIHYKDDATHDLKKEFWLIDNRLRFIFLSYVAAVKMQYDYTPTITCLYRTGEEQDDIYKYDPAYQVKKVISVHQVWRGLDFRSEDMSEELHRFTQDYFLKQVIYTGKPETLIRHSVGRGDHYHVQVSWESHTSIVRI